MTALRDHANRLPDILAARTALAVHPAILAALRRPDEDLRAIDDALGSGGHVGAGGRGVEGDELMHAAITAAGHPALLGRLMGEISELPGRPGWSH